MILNICKTVYFKNQNYELSCTEFVNIFTVLFKVKQKYGNCLNMIGRQRDL